jgi:hypothetical protein
MEEVPAEKLSEDAAGAFYFLFIFVISTEALPRMSPAACDFGTVVISVQFRNHCIGVQAFAYSNRTLGSGLQRGELWVG